MYKNAKNGSNVPKTALLIDNQLNKNHIFFIFLELTIICHILQNGTGVL